MSPDWAAKAEPVPYAKLENPQTLNLYAYVGNNPLSRTDPTGHYTCQDDGNLCMTQNDQAFKAGLAIARAAMDKLGADTKEGKAIGAVLKFYGSATEKNGDDISFGNLPPRTLGDPTAGTNGSVNIKFDLGQIRSFSNGQMAGTSLVERGAAEIHEGTHGVDDRAAGHGPQNRHEVMQSERNGYRNQSYVYQGLDFTSRTTLWSYSWSAGEAEHHRNAAIEERATDSTNTTCAKGCKP